MAISPVNELNQLLGAGNTNSQKSAAKTDSGFQNFMEEASRSTAVMQSNSYDSNSIQGCEKNGSYALNADNTQDSPEKTDKQDAKTEAANPSENKVEAHPEQEVKEMDEAAEKVEEAVIEETAKKLGISEEALLAVMEQLGLTAVDLLKPENVSLLVVNVLGDGDLAGIVTDETLLAVVKDINNTVAEITETVAADYAVDNASLIDALKQVNKETTALQQAVTEEMEMTEDAPSEDMVSKPEVTENALKGNDTAEDNSSSMQKESGDASAGQSFESRGSETVFTSQAMQSLNTEAVAEADSPMPVLTDPREILEQMSAQIRQRVTPEITQLQMQLNPENLGTVGLTVSMKEGQMTAQFTTQNEEVRAALEAQITILKENLEQQGVKIEAVEVMVGSHAFERNLEQGNDSNEQQEEEQEKLRKATRKIDLGGYGIAGEEDEFAEGELVTVDMMQADGNRMDYKV